MSKIFKSANSIQPAKSAQPIKNGESSLTGFAMRFRYIVPGLIGSCLLTGCLTHSKPPYANDPVLLHYKPDTADSATILAQQQGGRRSSEPTMPLAAPDGATLASSTIPRDPAVVPASAKIDQPLTPLTPRPLQTATPEPTAPLAPPPLDSQTPYRPSSPLTSPTTLAKPPALTPPEAGIPLSPPSSLPTRPSEFTAAASTSSPLPPPVQVEPVKEKPPFEVVDAGSPAKLDGAPPPFQTTSNSTPAASPFTQAPPAAFADAPPPVPGKGISAAGPLPMNPAAQEAAQHRAVPGDFGHDPNYHWVQGVLERHYHGDTCVRFTDPAVEDQYGGKFRLDDERLLSQYREGDVIGLEGEVVPASDRDRPGSTAHYLIHDVWLVRQK
jgi:hypothetical protein